MTGVTLSYSKVFADKHQIYAGLTTLSDKIKVIVTRLLHKAFRIVNWTSSVMPCNMQKMEHLPERKN